MRSEIGAGKRRHWNCKIVSHVADIGVVSRRRDAVQVHIHIAFGIAIVVVAHYGRWAVMTIENGRYKKDARFFVVKCTL